jgi:Sulfotransferase domain
VDRGGARIIALWSMPRSRSTAFFRMMAERGDFAMVHEPFSYLAELGRTEIDGREARTEVELLQAIRALARRRPVFFKDTTDERYPGLLADRAFLAADAQHTFLIRHPRETIASYYAINPRVRRHQIGAESLHEIYTAVEQLTGRRPVVVDAEDLVRRPEAVVRAYCAKLSIPYLPDALTWSPGSRPEWQPTARWHQDVSASTGFHTTSGRHVIDVDSHPVLGRYLEHHLPFYRSLRDCRLLG